MMKPVDLVLVEGFKKEKHAKLECYRLENKESLIYKIDKSICLIASDTQINNIDIPNVNLDDTILIADFILEHQGLI